MAEVKLPGGRPKGFGASKFLKSRVILQNMLNTVKCPLCQNVAVNPVSVGVCRHFFCDVCVAGHCGGQCPAPACSALAPAKDVKPDKLTHSYIKSVYVIKQCLGEKIPDRMKRHMSTVLDDEDIPGAKIPAEGARSNAARESGQATKSIGGPFEHPPLTGEKEVFVNETKNPGKANDEEASNKGSEKSGGSSEQTRPVARTRKAGKRAKMSSPPRGTSPPAKRAKQSSTPPGGGVASRKKPCLLEKRNRKGETALHSGTLKGDIDVVRKLLKDGANPNTVDNAGWSPLHEASIAGRVDLVRLLLDKGASPNLHAQEDNLTPLHDAASNGHLEVVRLLVSRGADVKARNSQGQTPRQVAGSEAVVRALDETIVEIPNQIADRSFIQQDELSIDRVMLACPGSSDADFKRMSLAAAKLSVSKPSRVVTEKTTHCLVDTSQHLATLLSAQLVGAQLVLTEWIFQCRQLGQLVDTEPFLLTQPDLTTEGRQRSRECRARGQPRLMTGLHFYLAGGGFDKPSKAELQRIIHLSGAKVINREPNPETIPATERTVPHHAAEGTSLAHTSHIILYQEGGKREPLLKYKMDHVKTLPLTWFKQSVFHHQLLPPDVYFQ